jgi:murein DD-endopeptidase MepM/ murein hydrolase activator NlpD
MAKYEKELYDLGQVQRYLGYTPQRIESLPEGEKQSALNSSSLGFHYYKEYFDVYHKSTKPTFVRDQRIVDIQSFQEHIRQPDITQIINFYTELSKGQPTEEKKEEEKEEEKKEEKEEKERVEEEDVQTKKKTEEIATTVVSPKKEDNTVPAELETLVAQYKLAQAKTLEADSIHTVADAVKRARNTWETRNKSNLIRENRLAKIEEASERNKQREIEDLGRDLFLVEKVDPKTRMANLIYKDIDNLSRKAIIAQAASLGIKDLSEAQIIKAAKDLSYLGLTGAIDITNYNDLNIASQLALKNQGFKIQLDIQEVDEVVQQREKALTDETYTNKPEELEAKIALADQKAREKLKESTDSFSTEIQKNLDLDDDFRGAIRTVKKVQNSLSQAIPNASLHLEEKPNLFQQNITTVEAALRKEFPDQIHINTEVIGAQTIGLLTEVHDRTRELSPEAVRFLSVGLTTEKFKELISKSKNVELKKMFFNADNSPTELYKQITFSLDKAEKTKIGLDIAAKLKPLTGLPKGVATLYNKTTSPLAQTAIKVVLNPVGTLKSWVATQAGKQIGKRLVERTGSALAQKLGGYLMKEGLEGGVKLFASEAAKKLALKVVTWAAVKLGVSLTAESLNAIVPGLGLVVDVLIQIGLVIVEKTVGAAYEAFQSTMENVYGSRITIKEVSAAGAILAGIGLTAGLVVFRGFSIVRRTFQLAAVSVVGIIITSIIAVGLYLGFAYLVAPILSTLVQFDSLERVDYSAATPIDDTPIAPGCPSAWPVKESFAIMQGPGGKASHSHPPYDQALDIAATSGTPVYSTSDGVVSFAGMSAVYLNTNIVTVDAKLPNGTAFQILYAHLSFVKVKQGQTVKVGDHIGASGTAGTGPHLHYEYKNIRYNLCPAGGVKMADNCAADAHPGAGGVCVPDGQPYLYSN